MRQNRKIFKLDGRDKEDICRKIDELAQSYAPEWRFTRNNPDIGSVIAMIFAEQLADNINRYNQVIYQYHTEFVNMLGVSLLPANPACATVLMTLAENTIPGTVVKKGTKLYTSTEGEEPITFETVHEVYITNSKLTDAFMVSAQSGSIVPLLGEFPPVFYVEPTDEEVSDEAQGEAAPSAANEMVPFELFRFTGAGIEKNALLLYHSRILDVEDNDILVRILGNRELLAGIASGAFQFLYNSEQGMQPVESYEVQGDIVILKKQQPSKKVLLEGKEYSLLALEAKNRIQDNIMVDSIAFSSVGRPVKPEYMGDSSREAEPEKCLPFGNEITLYKECYIGHDAYLKKPGAVITVSWLVDFQEHMVGIRKVEEEAELKTIKRKPKATWSDTPAHTWPEEIVMEYYNGSGWKRLPCNQDYKGMFAKPRVGVVEFTFTCPEDIQPVEVGGYEGCCLRLQVVRADNCYMRPCVHHYPVLTNCEISYSYESHYQRPERCIAVFGTSKVDITKTLDARESFQAFVQSLYAETALYLGFDKKFESGPISLFYELEDNTNFEGIRLRYEYSTPKGFKPLREADRTGMMTSSGTVMFLPPPDMTPVTLEGKKRYWIKVSPYYGGAASISRNYPQIRHIHLNAVESYNIDTLDEEDFFMDESQPNMSFFLHADHILDVRVWVNEKGSYTEEQMNRMLIERGDRIRAERDFLGNIDTFFVLWDEVPDFHFSQSTDRHYVLDRMNSKILFGDGIHVMTPQVVDGVALKTVVSCCNGQAGNVGVGRISESKSNILFVDRISNPLRAFGGSDIETVESALERGGNILSGRRRLVSEYDYIREIKSFSNNIDKVKCITGVLRDGTQDEHAISIVLLMKDYKNGPYSFHKEQARLMEHLCRSCEIVATEADIRIVEPIFLSVSVEVWLEISNMDDSFELQTLFEKSLEEYLEPVGGGKSGGWNIGVLPRYSQIMMRLNTLRSKAVVRKMSATVQYRDKSGVHEFDLAGMSRNSFAVCLSGKHQIHIQMSGEA